VREPAFCTRKVRRVYEPEQVAELGHRTQGFQGKKLG
jgi:hypothetical protein